jgi:predicted dinucleotide-binding enzyme
LIEERLMKIGIIGAGHIGSTLARRLTSLGHDVTVANSRGPETLKDVAAATGAHTATVGDAAKDKDVVIVTIPEKSVPDLPKGLFNDSHTVVVDTGNYYPRRDGEIADIESGMTESRWVSTQLGRPVVKAFNTIYAKHLLENGRPKGDRERIALPIAGDDQNAKAVVSRLIDELGFDPVDYGGLDDSWRQQPGTPVYGKDLPSDRARKALEQASSERKPEFRG